MALLRGFYLLVVCVGVLVLMGCAAEPAGVKAGEGAGQSGEGLEQHVRVTAVKSGAQRMPGAAQRANRSPNAKGPDEAIISGASQMDDAPLTGPTALVYGRVTFADGAPATSATIEIQGMVQTQPGYSEYKTFATGTTDADGRYSVRCQDARRLNLFVKGDLPETMVSLAENEQITRRSYPRLRRIRQDVVLVEAHKIAGRVVDEHGGTVAGAPVTVTPVIVLGSQSARTETRSRSTLETTTTEAGEFTMEHIAPGEWTVATAAPGYAPVWRTVEVPTSEPILLTLGPRGGTIRGVVKEKGTDAPLANIKVQLIAFPSMATLQNSETRTAADGTFQFENVSSVTLRIAAPTDEERKLGMTAPLPQPMNVADGETTHVTITMYPGHTVSGVVYDKDTSDPLSGARVVTQSIPEEVSAVADSAGRYQLENIIMMHGKGDLRLDAQVDGYELPSKGFGSSYVSVPLSEDALEATMDIPMVQMLTISGQVVTSEETPVGHAYVAFLSSDNPTISEHIAVNSDGTFELKAKPFSKGGIDAVASGFGDKIHEPVELLNEDLDGVKVVMEAAATVQGQVVGPEGEPVGGAKVMQWRRFGGTGYTENATVSGENGSFMITDAPTRLELFAQREGYADSEEVHVEVKPGEVRGGVKIVLGKSFDISGRVVFADGKPARGFRVSASGHNAIHGSTNADVDGYFTLADLTEGTYTISVMGSESKTVENIPAGTTELEIVLGEDDEAKSGYTLMGTVVDEETEEAIEDFTVVGHRAEKLSKPGQFKMTGLQPKYGYEVSISSPGYEKYNYDIERGLAGEVVEQTFKLGKGGAITGRVVTKADGKPLPNIPVINWGSYEQLHQRMQNSPRSHTTTDADGTFVLAPAPSGQNTIVIKATTPYPETEKVAEVKSGETTDLGDIELGEGGAIRGQVVRGEQDVPVVDEQVSLFGWALIDGRSVNARRNVRTDKEGRFELVGLQPMEYTVSVGDVSKEVKLGEGESAEVLIRLGGVTVSGRVSRGGQPVDATVTATSEDGQQFSVTASAGKYSLTNLVPGKYEFSVRKDAGGVTESVEVPDRPSLEKSFVLPDGRLLVTVVDSAGAPLEGARTKLSRTSAGGDGDRTYWGQTVTDSDGVYQYVGLSPGSYTATAMTGNPGKPGKPGQEFPVEVQEGQTQNVRVIVQIDEPVTVEPEEDGGI